MIDKIKKFVKDNYLDKSEKFIPGETIIPPSGKLVGKEEVQLMIEASLDAWLTTGRFNTEFQNELSNFLKVKHLITVKGRNLKKVN